MGFLTNLFSDNGNQIMTAAFALGAVIVLIILAVWLLKMVSKVSGNTIRGRNRRLAVVDTLAVDQKRQLVIVRRDKVEHLILVGGPQDLVVETGIPVEEAEPAQPSRRPLPMVPGRKRQDKEAATASASQPQPTTAATPATAIERLRELNSDKDTKSPKSLRHTGLLRPVSAEDEDSAGKTPEADADDESDSVKDAASKQSS